MNRFAVILMLSGLTSCVFTAEQFRNDRIKLLGTIDQNGIYESIVISTDNKHFAYAVNKGKENMYVVRDNIESKRYSELKPDTLVFSPNGIRLSYIAKEWEELLVFIDGIPVRPEIGKVKEIIPGTFKFSPDSGRYLFIVKDFFDKYVIINDGKSISPGFDEIRSNTMEFSPDSTHFAYIAKEFNKYGIYADNIKLREFDFIPYWTKIRWTSGNSFNYMLVDIYQKIYIITEVVE